MATNLVEFDGMSRLNRRVESWNRATRPQQPLDADVCGQLSGPRHGGECLTDRRRVIE